MLISTTGTVAREFQISRERVLQLLHDANIEPLRDATGRRLLTAKEVARLRRMRRLKEEARDE